MLHCPEDFSGDLRVIHNSVFDIDIDIDIAIFHIKLN